MLYFAYGANLSKAHMRLWCPSARPVGVATLADHRLAFRFWADLAPSPGDTVHGALYEIADADRAGLDEYEDCPVLYERVPVRVRTEDGPVEAVTYCMKPGYGFAPPAREYLNLILQGFEDWELDVELLPVATLGQEA